MIDRRRSVVAAMCMITALPVSAQSLADVARQEASRRETATPAAKAFTNTDLKVDPLAAPVSAPGAGAAEPAGYLSVSAGRYVTAAEIIRNSAANHVTAEKAVQEPDWRQQAETLRGQLLKGQDEVAAMTATAADESRSPGERAVAARLRAQRQAIVADLERRWLKLDEQAEKLRIPREWLDPRPTLSPKTLR